MMSLNSDMGEMNNLFAQAAVLNRPDVWLYASSTTSSDTHCWDAIYEFCYTAWQKQYVQRVERKFIYVFNYEGNGDPCSDNQITSWFLIDILDGNETRVLN